MKTKENTDEIKFVITESEQVCACINSIFYITRMTNVRDVTPHVILTFLGVSTAVRVLRGQISSVKLTDDVNGRYL